MTEYISREEAIETIQYRVCQGHGNKELICKRGSCAYCGIMEVMSDIESIEAAALQPVKHGRWITKTEDYYKAWQDSGRSWDDMPYFVTGLKFACSNCFEQFDVNAEGVEKWNGCPLCLARMGGEQNEVL